MKIEYLHASEYGNGAMVAEEFSKQMAAKGVTVRIHHIRARHHPSEGTGGTRDLMNAAVGLWAVPASADVIEVDVSNRRRPCRIACS
jgi:hypothetical protein